MDREQIIEIVKNYACQVKAEVNPLNVILYGTHAKGTATAESDIDVAVALYN